MLNCECNNVKTNELTMEEFIQMKARQEDQMDMEFINRIIQEVTQSCALNLPLPTSAIPPLIIQAAQYFWENDDLSVEERWLCMPNSEVQRIGANNIFKLPKQIVSVFGVYKTTQNMNMGALGDFSIERMLLNNAALAGSAGGSLTDVWGSGTGYNLADITGALYEISTYKALFDTPLTYNYNPYSNELVILGALGGSDLMLNIFKRCKLQDLYKNYYFFRYCVCLVKRSMAHIMGTFEFKLPGGITLNYNAFRDDANTEMESIHEWIKGNHAADYFFNTNTI